MARKKKYAPDSGKNVSVGQDPESAAHPLNRASGRLLPHAWVGLVVVAGLLIALGILHNDMTAVFSKAAAVCLECIGIG